MKQELKREAGADLGLILTDFLNERRRPKLLRGPGACPNGKFFSILISQRPLSWVSESFRQDNLASSFSSDEALQLLCSDLISLGKANVQMVSSYSASSLVYLHGDIAH